MNIALLFFYIMSFMGLLVSGFLHGKDRPKELCKYDLPRDIVKTIMELLMLWWILGWKAW